MGAGDLPSSGGSVASWGEARVLVVEDDATIAEPLAEGLERAGFGVALATTGRAALAAGPVDVVLLDLGLPDLDGAEVARQLRARSDVPMIVVTARGAELDRVLLLEMGADDYVVKPFGLRELVARIRAVLRRAQQAGPTAEIDRGAGSEDGLLDLGALVVDRRAHRVVVDGTEVELTRREYDLLALLASDPGAVFTRERIIDEVWDPHWWGPTKTLDVHIAGLRRKLGHPEWIGTIRGVGYRLDVP